MFDSLLKALQERGIVSELRHFRAFSLKFINYASGRQMSGDTAVLALLTALEASKDSHVLPILERFAAQYMGKCGLEREDPLASATAQCAYNVGRLFATSPSIFC